METILRRERLIIGGCLAAIALLAWVYLFHTGGGLHLEPADTRSAMLGMDMPGMDMPGMVMPRFNEWSVTTVLLLYVMWAVMMVAMMVPSAAPMVLAFLSLNQRRRAASRAFVPVGIFLAGYLTVWAAYSAVATLAQWRLHEAALLSPQMAATSPLLSGGLLVVAGVFQWTPLKRACLKGCRSPLTFLMSEWREGKAGAFIMGLRHGADCIGCCWVLMALLFVAGVMNLLWVAVIALFVMVEKLLAKGDLVGRIGGIVMVIAGLTVIVRAW